MTIETELSPFELLLHYAQKAEERQAISEDYQEDKVNYLAFRAGDQRFLIDVKYILEITIALDNISPLPFTPRWLLGLASSRGDVYSVVDFRCFNNPDDPEGSRKNASYIILQDEGAGYILKVDEILSSGSFEVQPYEDWRKWIKGRYLLGGQPCLQIDLVELVSDSTFIQSNKQQ